MDALNPVYENLAVWIYSIVGTLFFFYFFITFVQKEINNKIRLSVSMLFLSIGLFFFNAAGKIMTGYKEHFTILAIISAMLLAGVGLICVYIIYRENRLKRKEDLDKL